MKKYYVLEISEGADSIKGAGVYTYNTANEAIGAYHQKLGTAMRSDLFTSELIVIIDSNGEKIVSEKYIANSNSEDDNVPGKLLN